uniref:glycosyltransferase n=1 Tax=Pedobacter schmidteae TaxID=2201271 RepID=UPI0013CF0A53|nr:glycosyltransferase [Pedobacter schmidteae]
MYHKVYPFSPSIWWVKTDDFYRQMWELQSKKVVYLDDYNPDDPTHVVITFDGIYKNVLQFAAPILKKFNYPFELFITSDYLGLDNEFDTTEPRADFTTLVELKQLESLGGRVQWHTRSHPDLLHLHDQEEITQELTVPQDLSNTFPAPALQWFAYPYGNFNPDVVAIAKTLFKGALSCVQGNNHDQHIYNRITVSNETTFKTSTIACIISSYNYGAYLTEAIESVLRQTILPDEILITDDCSDDSTQEISEHYASKYPQLIRFNRNQKNLGIVANFNKAAGLTTADYLFFLGADNRLASNYIESCAALLNTNPDIGVAYTDYHLFGPRAKLIFDTNFAHRYQSKVILNAFYHIIFPDFDNARTGNLIEQKNFIHGSAMYRRTAYNEVGGYRQQTDKPEDWDFFYRILLKGFGAKKAANTTLEYRQHSKDQANNKYISQSLLLHYMGRARASELKYTTLLNRPDYRLFSKYLKFRHKLGRLRFHLKKGNFRFVLQQFKKAL